MELFRARYVMGWNQAHIRARIEKHRASPIKLALCSVGYNKPIRPVKEKWFAYIKVRFTSYVSRKCLFYGVCEFFFCSFSVLATYLPLVFENCHLHCHLRFCKRLFFISKRKCIGNRFTVSCFRFLKHMTVDITRCSYAGMSHIT